MVGKVLPALKPPFSWEAPHYFKRKHASFFPALTEGPSSAQASRSHFRAWRQRGVLSGIQVGVGWEHLGTEKGVESLVCTFIQLITWSSSAGWAAPWALP